MEEDMEPVLVIIVIVCIIIIYRTLTAKRHLRREISNTRWRINNAMGSDTQRTLTDLEEEYFKLVGGGFLDALKYTLKEIGFGVGGCLVLVIIIGIIIGIIAVIVSIAKC